MKILLSAFSCEPGRGSEEGVGWGLAWALSHRHRVHVLTASRHRMAIEKHLVDNPRPYLTFSYFDFSHKILRWVRTSFLWQIYYYLWQRRIAGWAAKVSSEFDPDVVHHATYGRYWAPSSLWKLGKPFLWGPLGGADNTPHNFLPSLRGKERLIEQIRPLIQWLAGLDPAVRATARYSAVAFASTPATAARLRKLGCTRVQLLLQMAVDESCLNRTHSEPATQPTFCCIGKLTGWKGQHLAIEAFASAGIPGARLLIIGEGNARRSLENLACNLGVTKTVHFLGNIPREEALTHLASAHALLHPSLHDQAPTVVFEAMSLAVPVIALALGGLPGQVTSETGFLIAATTPQNVIIDLAKALKQLVDCPELRHQLGANGRFRVTTIFTWAVKADQIERFYAEVLGAPARQESLIAFNAMTTPSLEKSKGI